MTFPTRFQIGAALLVASLATFARASDVVGDVPDTKACVAAYQIVFHSEGRPPKSIPFVRQTLDAPSRCVNAAPGPLYLTVFTDAPGGSVLLEGQYAAAIAQIRQTTRVPAITSLPVTNLCVAQIAAREWADARLTCDAAIQAARLDRVRASSWHSNGHRYRDFVAVAYSNRAVLMLLSDDLAAGEDDLRRAEKVAPRAQFVKRNLAATRLVRDTRVLARARPEEG